MTEWEQLCLRAGYCPTEGHREGPGGAWHGSGYTTACSSRVVLV